VAVKLEKFFRKPSQQQQVYKPSRRGSSAARFFYKPSRRGSGAVAFFSDVAARQRQLFSRDGHLCITDMSKILRFNT
jgi:hypothetical protein